MSTTIPALSSVTDILDSDLVMITHSNGESFKIAGSEINKRNQAVIASGTTITGAPLKTGNIVRVYFTADITGSNTSTGLTLNYNGVNKSVKVPKNGTLANFVASDLGGSPTVYKYLQAHTTLELLYDGTQFIIIENPVVISGSNFRIHADGSGLVDTVASNNMHSVTSNAVYNNCVLRSFITFTDVIKELNIQLEEKSNYRVSMIHPTVINKEGEYLISVQNNTYSKIENLLNVNNYTLSISNKVLNIKTSTAYGFVMIEKLMSW